MAEQDSEHDIHFISSVNPKNEGAVTLSTYLQEVLHYEDERNLKRVPLRLRSSPTGFLGQRSKGYLLGKQTFNDAKSHLAADRKVDSQTVVAFWWAMPQPRTRKERPSRRLAYGGLV